MATAQPNGSQRATRPPPDGVPAIDPPPPDLDAEANGSGEAEAERKSKPRGRKNSAGQQAVIETAVVANKILNLEALYIASQLAANAFDDAIKATAESSGLIAAVIRKYVLARAKSKSPDVRRDAAQLCLLFDEVGEGQSHAD